MRTCLVTSALTFVPENYNRLILRLAQHPSVVGLIEIENRESSVYLKAFGMIFSLSAPRMGWTLIQNSLDSSRQQRRQAFEKQGKWVKVANSPKSSEILKLIENEPLDLILNARTRVIYREELLNKPRLGCLNIHHGLLPQQRGLMCDFWAHLEGEHSGFSIHQMTSKIDDGPILRVQKVDSHRKDYLKTLLQTSEIEADVGFDLLTEIQSTGRLQPLDVPVSDYRYRKNPSLLDGYRLQMRGIKV